jgi:hypothetical protein
MIKDVNKSVLKEQSMTFLLLFLIDNVNDDGPKKSKQLKSKARLLDNQLISWF